MRINFKTAACFFIVVAIAFALRFYQLDKLPPGLILDEASEGYNAFSLLQTGKDRYGQSFPILFRSFASYQAPLYTYLSIVPVYFFGNSIFSIHFISAVSGMILVVLTFLLNFQRNGKRSLSIIASLIIAVSPWTIFYSRFGTEANLGVSFFIFSFFLFYLSLKRLIFFPFAMIILGLSTHAYYSERVISYLFLIGFILLFRKSLLFNKKIFILGILLFIITQIPHVLIINSGAFTRRIAQVDYFSSQFYQTNGGNFRNIIFGHQLFIGREFLSQYFAYFSPKNLFFDPDPQDFRSIPDLSVFYSWMLLPFIFGLRELMKNYRLPIFKMLILLILVAPIPAALTRDPFSTIRVLVFLWTISVIIAFGIQSLLYKLPGFKIKFLISLLVLISFIQLYISYFVLLKYERSEQFGYSSLELLKKTEQLLDKKFVVDSSRDIGIGIKYAFLKAYNPLILQQELSRQIRDQYYSNFEFDEPYKLDNIEARPIVWEKDICQDQILVGDLLAISQDQVQEHNLNFLFDIRNPAGSVAFKAYQTNPLLACKINPGKI